MQALANGLVQGLWVAVLALSFALVYRPTAIFFVALAGVYAAVPFVSQELQNVGCGSVLASALAILTGALLALACQWLNHERLIRKNAPPGVHMVSSLGIYIVIQQTISIIWGSDTRTLERTWGSNISFGTIHLSPAQIATGMMAFLALVAAYMFLKWSDVGLRLRAHADDPFELGLLGYSLPQLRTMCFGLSGLFCGVASLLAAQDLGFDPQAGLPAFLLAVVAVVVGGKGSFWGPLLGGLLLGVARSAVVWQFSSRWQDGFTFLLLALVLVFRPQGLAPSLGMEADQ